MSPRPVLSLLNRAWSEPKPGNTVDENEDAFAVRVLDDRGRVLLALADGASATIHSRAWAQLLVASAEPEWLTLRDDELTARLDDLRDRFDLAHAASGPWYVQRKTTKYGSQAALLVVLLDPAGNDGGVSVRALAVGDCNVMVLQAKGAITSFPMQSSSSFSSTPALVASRPQSDLSYGRWGTRIDAEDVVLASSDAVGQWMLACVEANRQDALVQVLIDLASATPIDSPEPGNLATSRVGLRETLSKSTFQHPLREDDLTLVMCQPLSTEAPRRAIPAGSTTTSLNDLRRRLGLRNMIGTVARFARRIR